MGNFDKTPSSSASEPTSQPSLEKVPSSIKISEKPQQKNLVVNVVREEIQKQNDDIKNGCFCEINTKIEENNPQRRPRSVPSSEKCRNVGKFRNPRAAVELFNPDYNFETKHSGIQKTGMTLLESIRKRVFSNNEATFDSTGQTAFLTSTAFNVSTLKQSIFSVRRRLGRRRKIPQRNQECRDDDAERQKKTAEQ